MIFPKIKFLEKIGKKIIFGYFKAPYLDEFVDQLVVECHYDGVRNPSGALTFKIPQGLIMKHYKIENGVGGIYPVTDKTVFASFVKIRSFHLARFLR